MEFKDRIPKLIAGYLRGELTSSEQKELDDWINKKEANKIFFAESINEKLLAEELRHFNKKDKTPILDNTLQNIDPGTKTINKGRLVQMKRYMAAAACLVAIAATAIYIVNRVSNKKDISITSTNHTKNNDVQPGTEKAVLTLADGTKITIDNTANGAITQQGNTVVMKEDGLLAYNVDQNRPQTEILYNILTTARGEEFKSLVLADGTKVWLNSVSSIRFPAAFIGKERNVEITGEAYFEVAHDAARPFTVLVNGMEIQVLGTHFNVNAYADEGTITTTLLEGKVKVSKNSGAVLLKPGQQAQLTNQDQLKLVENADIDAAVAWKNGMFSFNASNITTVMQQITRWYDVDVVYAGNIKETFFLKVNRNTNVSNVFKILETTGGVHFEIDGKKITVKP